MPTDQNVLSPEEMMAEIQDPFDYDKAKKNPTLLSIQFIKKNKDLLNYNGELYFWNGRFFDCPKESKLHQLIWKFYEDSRILPSWTPQSSKNFIEALRCNYRVTYVEEIDDYESLLNLNNCVFSLDTLEPCKHDPKYHFSYIIDVDYDPATNEHPEFDKFLATLFTQSDGNPDTDSINLIWYIFAYFLYTHIKIETMFMFIGNGANGKSVLIDIMKMFFPKKYVTAISLNEMSDEKSPGRFGLIHSRLNIATEQRGGGANKIDSEEIKRIVSGETILLNEKFKQHIPCNPKTKILVASNELPFFNDTTHGIVRRLTMVEFKNKFVLKEDYVKEENPASKGIFLMRPKDEILKAIQKEKSAIFNTLITYLAELKARDWRLPSSENADDLKEEYMGVSDVFGTWLNDSYVVDEDMPEEIMISSVDILNEFLDFYASNYPNKKSPHSSHIVGRKVKQIFRTEGRRIRRDIVKSNGSIESLRLRVYPLKRKNVKRYEQIPLTDIWSEIVSS